MALFERIIVENCRLCHIKPGLYDFKTDKQLIKDIFECTKIKVNDKIKNLLPNCVCEECRELIKTFTVFKQTVREVDKCLKKIIKDGDIKNESVEQEYKCNDCPADFNNEKVFKNHQNSHLIKIKTESTENRTNCLNCNLYFENLEAYSFHTCAVNDTKDIQNDIQIDTKLFCHNLSVPNRTKNFICAYKNCQKTLSSAYTLKTHHLKHQGIRSFLCVTCGGLYLEKQFKTWVLGKSFITKNSLMCHEKIHLEVKSYFCKPCNIGFSVRSNLRAHEKKHHENVKFYCSQCTKAFSSKCSLQRHERIHTGIKDFKCDSCPAAFYTNKELLKHKRYHQGLRSHKCDECFKTFFEKHHLIIHLRSHTGERPYVCQFPKCGKAFAESQKLKRHHNAKHPQIIL